ncbi:MAG: penicillin-binding protein 2 [Gemmatimonadota bacterium]
MRVADPVRPRRAAGATAVLLGVIGILVAAFFQLQVVGRSEFELRSRDNRLRPITIPPARGAIYDRRGRVLADNVPGYSISLLPGPVDSARATLQRLASYLALDSADVEAHLTRFRRHPQSALVVSDNLSFEQVAAIEERRPEFRHTVIDTHPRRRYPSGQAIGHVIGYVGEISEDELDSAPFLDYDAGRIIGRQGIERQYEASLGGTPGMRYVEVNARNMIVSEFGGQSTVEALTGTDLVLGLDLTLQEYADSIFPEGRRGGLVALDPTNGEVLALYSHPTFDPNLFIGGISTDDWSRLRDDPDRPLLNRVTTALYPAGSTWKLVMATLGMRDAGLGIGSVMPTACGGALQYGRRSFRCWKPSGHGILDLSGAIKESCNVFFYQVGLRIGLDPLLEGVNSLGFNNPTGIDLPSETSSRFPVSREWYDTRFGPRGWTESVILNLSIGQGETEQTLLRMAQFYSALALGESPVIPHLIRNESLDQRRESWTLGLPEERRLELLGALKRVVNEPGGTAYGSRLADWTAAGKTGTAQNPHGEPHSWFVGFAPLEAPRIVIAAIVEQGHPDNQASLAVPLATKVMNRFLELEEVEPNPPLPIPTRVSLPLAAADE